MILSDKQIKAAISDDSINVSPFYLENLGCNSYDLHLGSFLEAYTEKVLDARKNNPTKTLEIPKEGLVLMPNILYLGFTIESAGSSKYVPILEGKSSIGRLGIKVHLTAGVGDVGFNGHWTLEIEVTQPVRIYAGMAIAQILFHTCGEVEVPYNEKKSAKYINQPARPIASKNHLNEF
jgi:dCTP deaminase